MACDSLRVSNIINDISSPLSFSSFSHMLKLGLTDGWHKIDAYIDPPLQQVIAKPKIKICSKLEICSPRIYGESVEKIPVSDATRSMYLKLSGNTSTLL